MDSKEHIKRCEELLKEAASRINMIIELKEYKEGRKVIGIEILLKNGKGLIYKNYDDVSDMLGYIHGYEYNL